MQKQLKVPAVKTRLRAAIWIVIMTGAAWHCPDAHAQAGPEPATPPSAETFFYRFPRSAKRDSLLALLHPGGAGRVPVYLAVRHHYSPLLAKAAKNNPDSLIRVGLLQDPVLTGGGRLPLYRAASPGIARNPKLLSPANGTVWDKIRRKANPLTLDEYLRLMKKKP